MHPRAATLIDTLGLVPHPEGGHYREVHRSGLAVLPADGRRARAALTVIYFLLAAGEISRLHRVASDETWHFHEGDPIELMLGAPGAGSLEPRRLGPGSAVTEPVRVVPGGFWQAARTTGAFTLVSCCVGPGFDFEDFEMMRDRPDADDVRRLRPDLAEWM
ncbi:MAG: cupin domain-containing protein [Acidobacteria bacterium]|nr:cupin domain-containing protein [Acidobacteriota bacterium]